MFKQKRFLKPFLWVLLLLINSPIYFVSSPVHPVELDRLDSINYNEKKPLEPEVLTKKVNKIFSASKSVKEKNLIVKIKKSMKSYQWDQAKHLIDEYKNQYDDYLTLGEMHILFLQKKIAQANSLEQKEKAGEIFGKANDEYGQIFLALDKNDKIKDPLLRISLELITLIKEDLLNKTKEKILDYKMQIGDYWYNTRGKVLLVNILGKEITNLIKKNDRNSLLKKIEEIKINSGGKIPDDYHLNINIGKALEKKGFYSEAIEFYSNARPASFCGNCYDSQLHYKKIKVADAHFNNLDLITSSFLYYHVFYDITDIANQFIWKAILSFGILYLFLAVFVFLTFKFKSNFYKKVFGKTLISK